MLKIIINSPREGDSDLLMEADVNGDSNLGIEELLFILKKL
jgi:hypothetical protein